MDRNCTISLSPNYPHYCKCCPTQDNLAKIGHVTTDLRSMFINTSWTRLGHATEYQGYFWELELLEVYSTIQRIWLMTLATIFRNIWYARNMRCFDGVSTKARCLMFLYRWVYLSSINVYLLEFCQLPSSQLDIYWSL